MTLADAAAPSLPASAIVHRACPHCASEGRRRLALGPDEWPLVQCEDCGFVYLAQAPDYAALTSAMAWEQTATAEAARRDAQRPVARSFSRLTRARMRLLPRKTMPELLRRHARPGRVLDLGSGDGGQLAKLDAAFQPIGLEVSARIAANPHPDFAARGGVLVNKPSLEGLQGFPDAHFTAITLRSYLEHELHPRPVLRESFRVLAPGGVAIVKVPHYGSLNRRIGGEAWCGFRFPDHCNYFTPASLRRMAEEEGFQVRFGLSWRLPTSDNFWALLTKPAEVVP